MNCQNHCKLSIVIIVFMSVLTAIVFFFFFFFCFFLWFWLLKISKLGIPNKLRLLQWGPSYEYQPYGEKIKIPFWIPYLCFSVYQLCFGNLVGVSYKHFLLHVAMTDQLISDELWETDFDPVHVLLRAVYKKDFQSAMDRYTEL